MKRLAKLQLHGYGAKKAKNTKAKPAEKPAAPATEKESAATADTKATRGMAPPPEPAGRLRGERGRFLPRPVAEPVKPPEHDENTPAQ